MVGDKVGCVSTKEPVLVASFVCAEAYCARPAAVVSHSESCACEANQACDSKEAKKKALSGKRACLSGFQIAMSKRD